MVIIKLNPYPVVSTLREVLCWSKVLLHATPCSRQLVHSNLEEDARDVLKGVTHMDSVSYV